MLIEGYDLEVYVPACHPDGSHHAARARIAVDISEALPYLNATLKGALYFKDAGALTWDAEGHSLAFHANLIECGDVKDRPDAERKIGEAVALVNSTWERRAELRPDHNLHRRPDPMTLFKLLPRINCGRCGDATCFSFALKLSVGQMELTACAPLAEAQYAGKRAALEALVS